jgi:hypothetical protein
VLLNNFRPDEDDRFYFIYRFAVRSWLLFLSVIFSVPVGAIFGRSVTGKQFLAMCGAFILIVAVDFLSVWIKACPIYKERERVEWETFGRRKTR